MNLHNKRIGLALSGGGMRAAMFHLGLLKYLAEAGLFGQIANISSVSGASLCIGAIFAASKSRHFTGRLKYHWPDDDEFINVTLPEVSKLFLTHDIQIAALRRLSLAPYQMHSRVNLLAKVLEKKWGVIGGLQDLPEFESETSRCPFWEINCTSYYTGENFRIRKDYMGGEGIGYVLRPNLPISHMIAASAGFPGLIGPYSLKTKGMRWYSDKKGEEGEITQKVHPVYSLWDGGVYDNLGLEALHKIETGLDDTVDFIIVSNASKPFKFIERRYKSSVSVSNAKRLIDVTNNQVLQLRKKDFFADVLHKGKGSYLHMQTEQARNYPTNLRKPTRQAFNLLLEDGYNAAKGLCNCADKDAVVKVGV